MSQLMDGSILMVDPAEPIGFRESLPLPAPSIPKQTFNLKSLYFAKEIFSLETLEHIFFGTIRKGKEAVGFHYNKIHNGFCEIVGTKEFLNGTECYKANVKIGGILKKAKSTFFPDSMSPQRVIDAITEAYHNKILQRDGIYHGVSKCGIKIEMRINNKGKITSAYPTMNQ